jgi:succinate-semialdehyde dehydrogenase/glutarate-semialdehyde dehydrogenase
MNLSDKDLFRHQAWVAGRWVDADNGETIQVVNPANGAVLGTVPRMAAGETRRAIEAAQAAGPEWRARTGKERAAVLKAWFELVMRHQDDLAAIMTAEQGKPLVESRGEIAYAAPSSSGSRKRARGSMATPFPVTGVTSGSSY